MPEATQICFTHREVAEALVKRQGLHEGLWGIYVEFGFAAANLGSAPTNDDLMPTALVRINKIGIQRFAEPNNLTVDAAQANPLQKTRKPASARKTHGKRQP